MTIYRHKVHTEHRIEVTSIASSTVAFFRQGGGFNQVMPRATFDAEYEIAPAPEWRLGYVSADWLTDADGERIYLPCWSDGSLWNGWGMPYFDRNTVGQLGYHLGQIGGTPLAWVHDAVAAKMDVDEIELYYQTCLPDGTPVWGVGAGSWTWDSVVFVPTVEESIARMKREVIEMIKDGQITVEQTFCDFGDLPLDANCLGGFCDDSLADAMIAHYGGRDEHEGMPQGMLDHINAAQEAVHQWLARRDHLKELK